MAAIAKLLGIKNNILNIKTYSISTTEFLGQGAFGVVFKGKDAKKNPIAAKRIDGSQHTKVLTHNYEKLLQLDHPNIIQILDIDKQDNIFWMFMEFCQMGDLNKFYKTREVKMDSSENLMVQIVLGILYLHNRDIIHRDIKPGNILVASEDPLLIKLTDFDVTKCLDPDIETSLMSSNVGTNAFKAPEFFMRNKEKKIEYHRNVDIYAAGLTFLAILQHKKEDTMLIPRIETPQDDSELFLPIGQLIAERIKYKVKELDIVVLEENLMDSVATLERDDGHQLKKREIRKLIQRMTCHQPEKRLSGDVLKKVWSVYTKRKANAKVVSLMAVNCVKFMFIASRCYG